MMELGTQDILSLFYMFLENRERVLMLLVYSNDCYCNPTIAIGGLTMVITLSIANYKMF
jgi:hypothetical protein